MDIETARKFFSNDRFATENGITLEERDERHAVASLALAERHRNAHGGVMGGAIFTLADLALAVTANQIHLPSVAQQVSITYLNAPKGEQLFAKARAIKSGKTTTVINVDVTDDTGRWVAQFVGTAFKL